MSRQTAPTPSGPDVFAQLGVKIREFARQEHLNNGSGAEMFTVKVVSPLQIEAVHSSLVLTDGEPDFVVGGWMRQYMMQYQLAVGDVVWCLREANVWHLIDVSTTPGSAQAQWTPATTGP